MKRLLSASRREESKRLRRLAAAVPGARLRDCLLRISHLYDVEADLMDGSAAAIAESREVLLRADVALYRDTHNPM